MLLHSNGIYYSNSHVHLLKRIRSQHCHEWNYFQENNYQTTTKKTFRIWLSHLMVWQKSYTVMLQIEIFRWFQLKRFKQNNEGNWTSLIRSGRCRTSNLSFAATKELRWKVQCRKKLNKSCLSIHNIGPYLWLLCKFQVHWSILSHWA